MSNSLSKTKVIFGVIFIIIISAASAFALASLINKSVLSLYYAVLIAIFLCVCFTFAIAFLVNKRADELKRKDKNVISQLNLIEQKLEMEHESTKFLLSELSKILQELKSNK